MFPLTQKGSAARTLQYENPKSAIAEEKLLSLLMAQPELCAKASEKLTDAMFSVPIFGRVFARMQALACEKSAFTLTALTRDCTAEETAQLAGVFAKFVGGDASALSDYIKIIEREQWKKQGADSDDALLEAMKRFQSKKANGEG